MGQSISKTSILLAADNEGAESGLKKTSDSVKHFADNAVKEGGRASAAMAKIGGGMGGALSAVKGHASSILSSIGGLKGGLGTVAGGPAGILAGLGIGAVSGAVDKLKELNAVGRDAKALGIASDQYMGLQAAFEKAGLSGEVVGHVFGHMSKEVIKGAQEGGEAAEKFRDMGLDVDELAKMSPDQAFLKISTAIAKLPPGMGQANAAMSVFGRSGAELLPVLTKGGDALQSFIDKGKKTGQFLNPAEMKAAQQAAAALPKIGEKLEGVKNRMVIAIAPIIELIGTKLAAAFDFLQPAIQWFTDLYSTYWTVLFELASEAIEYIGGGIQEVIDWAREMNIFGDDSISIKEVVVDSMRVIAIGVGYVWDALRAGVGVVAEVFGFLMENIHQQGMSPILDLIDMLKMLPENAKPEWVDGLTKGADQFRDKIAAAGKDVSKWGKDQVDKFGHSADAINKKFDSIKDHVLGAKKDVEDAFKAPIILDKKKEKKEKDAKDKEGENKALVVGTADVLSSIVMASRDTEQYRLLGNLDQTAGKIVDAVNNVASKIGGMSLLPI